MTAPMQHIVEVRSPSIIRENVDRGLNRVITDDDLDESQRLGDTPNPHESIRDDIDGA